MKMLSLVAVGSIVTACAFGDVHAESKQELGIQLYERISNEVSDAYSELEKDFEKLNWINRNAHEGNMKFPRGLKSSMEGKMHGLIRLVEKSIDEARKVNSKIGTLEQNRECESGVENFEKNELVPWEARVKQFEELSVEGKDLTAVLTELSTDLSIRNAVATGKFLTEALANCLMLVNLNYY